MQLDLTQLVLPRHVENALSERQRSEERLRTFSADASHELRTPVASVRGHAELALLHRGPVPPEVTHALERIVAQSGRMGAMVDDLLLLANARRHTPPGTEVTASLTALDHDVE